MPPLPLHAFAVPCLGAIQSCVFIRFKLGYDRNGAWSTPEDDLWKCWFGRHEMLLAYRLAAFAWGLYVGVDELLRMGPKVLKFYTNWNWWLLTAYFGLAAYKSLAALLRDRRRLRQSKAEAGQEQQGGVGASGYVMVTMFHVALTSAMIVDSLSWGLLWPMCKADPDPVKVAEWTRGQFSFTSYNQHIFNLVLLTVELALNRMPFYSYQLAWLGLWGVLYTLWSLAYYSATNEWLYLFQNPELPNAALLQCVIFLTHWLFFLVARCLFYAKELAMLRLQAPPQTVARQLKKAQ